MIKRALSLSVLALLFGLSAMPFGSFAQGTYPTRPIMVAVGLQAGTGSDIAVRMLTERMAASMGQSLVIENLPSAGGILAATKGAKAKPDGYQLAALSAASLTVLPLLEASIPYDPFKDLVPIAIVAAFPSVFFVRADLPVKTIAEFVELARKNPGKMTYASGGNGSVQHLATETFKALANIDVVHVPYKGSAQAVLDVVAGRIDSGFQGISTVLPYIKAGKLKALASSGAQRAALFPDLPTIQEAGIQGFTYEPWTALFAPANTPKALIDRLHSEVRKATAAPEFRERWVGMGLAARDHTADQLAALIREEYAANAKVIKENNIRAN